mmetsp:Transcript_60927/g.69699  ORF Transcript_60927/g.69699 Transcript_60927/m.69699 type:complete len:325 (-) Transcript_60927:577-1551(-)
MQTQKCIVKTLFKPFLLEARKEEKFVKGEKNDKKSRLTSLELEEEQSGEGSDERSERNKSRTSFVIFVGVIINSANLFRVADHSLIISALKTITVSVGTTGLGSDTGFSAGVASIESIAVIILQTSTFISRGTTGGSTDSVVDIANIEVNLSVILSILTVGTGATEVTRALTTNTRIQLSIQPIGDVGTVGTGSTSNITDTEVTLTLVESFASSVFLGTGGSSRTGLVGTFVVATTSVQSFPGGISFSRAISVGAAVNFLLTHLAITFVEISISTLSSGRASLVDTGRTVTSVQFVTIGINIVITVAICGTGGSNSATSITTSR